MSFIAILAGLFVLFGPGASQASAQNEAVQGTLNHDGSPVAGVNIRVSAEAGGSVGEATSAADGTWRVPVPSAGKYKVELDQSTLPNGLVISNGRPSLVVEVFDGTARTVLFPLGTQVQGGTPATPDPGATSGPADPSVSPEAAGSGRVGQVVTLLYSGFHWGLILALAALGLSLIFGTTGLTNFAHGELVTFGAVMGLLFNSALGMPLIWAALAAVAAGGLLGWIQDQFFWSWLRRRGTGLIAMMIISIGVALLMRNTYLYAIGGRNQRYTEYVIQETLELGPLTVVPKTLVADTVALVVLISVSLALMFTRMGKATRAVADNPALAEASGINVNTITRLVWSTGGALAALAGVILAVDQGVTYQMGLDILLLIFAAVVLGGLGTAFGSMLGALVVGIFVQVSTLWINPELKYVGALVVLILILMVRPQGILGRRERIG